MAELLDQIVVEEPMFEAVHGLPGLTGKGFESHPDQEGTGDMIALNARFAALTAFQARQLLAFAVQLLDLPAYVTHLLCGFRGVSSGIVGHDPVRAAGRRHNPEQLHMMVTRKAFDLDPFAHHPLLGAPIKDVHPLVGPHAARIIDLAIILERAVVHFPERLNIQHQIFGGIPSVHQDSMERKLFVEHEVVEHVSYMVEFGLAITVGIIDAIVDEPELVGLRIDVDTGHDPNPFDHGAGVATILPPDQLDDKRVVLIEDSIVKNDVAPRCGDHILNNIFPDQARRQSLVAEVAINRVMAKLRAVIGEVGQRVVDLTHQQVLAIIQARHSLFHGRYSTGSGSSLPINAFFA
jgi:hypothetical protein